MLNRGHSYFLAKPAFCLALIFCAITDSAHAQVSVQNISILSDKYATKTLSATFNFVPELGGYLTFDVVTTVEDAPQIISAERGFVRLGESEVSIVLNRPIVRNEAGIVTEQLLFRFFGESGAESSVHELDFELSWQGIADYFPPNPERTPFTSIQRLALDESIQEAAELFPNILGRGISSDEVVIFDSAPRRVLDGLVVRFAEDVEFTDVSAVLNTIADLGLQIRNIGFIQMGDENFEQGLLRLSTVTNLMGGTFVDEQKSQAMLNAESLLDIFALANFEPTLTPRLVPELLAKAQRLNNSTSLRDARTAQEIANSILEIDPANMAAYVEHARAEIAFPNGAGRYTTARNTMRLALNIAPNDPRALHFAGYLEMEVGAYDAALQFYTLAQQNLRDPRELVWLPTHWAVLLGFLGETDASLEKFQELLAFDGAQLDTPNQRALFIGLEYYAEALESIRSTEIEVIYESLLAHPNERARCVPVRYAMYMLRGSHSAERAKEMLGRAEEGECDDYQLTSVLIDVVAWHVRNGPGLELYPLMIRERETWRLLYAAANLDEGADLIQVLEANAIDLNSEDQDGTTAMFLAMEENNVFAMRQLVAGGADVDHFNQFGLSPLLQAVFQNDITMVRTLIKLGASTDLGNENGVTPSNLAERAGYEEILQMLDAASSSDV